jgi:hypothetical protein
MLNKNLFIIFVFLFLSLNIQAYPEFIGYGYTTCLTCHYNGAGNGPLSDYGRGLFASEIAAKPFWNPNVEDETLSESSGFLGKKELPWWFRPGYKARRLSVITDPTKVDKQTKQYVMQNDFSFVFLLNEDQKLLMSYNIGFLDKPEYAYPNRPLDKDLIVTREHYLRWQVIEPIWIYFGFMDKTFGIKHADHTAVNRSAIDLGQNDQVHGMVIQYSKDQHEIFLNPYAGNLRAEKSNILPGFAFTYEFEPFEKKRIGISLLTESNETIKKSRAALIGKIGIGSGNSFLIETGIDTNQIKPSPATTGGYAYAQGTIKLTRGLNFQSIGQYSKSDLNKVANENLRWGFGLLYFPFQRLELRAQAVTKRTMSRTSVDEDSWTIQTQAHVSL